MPPPAACICSDACAAFLANSTACLQLSRCTTPFHLLKPSKAWINGVDRCGGSQNVGNSPAG